MTCVVYGISPLLNHEEERNRGTARSPARDHAAVPVRRAHAQGHVPLVRPLGQVHERAVRAAHRAHAQLRRRGREGGPRARVRAVNEREGRRASSICMRLRGRVAPRPVAPTTGRAGRRKGHESCRAIAGCLGTPTRRDGRSHARREEGPCVARAVVRSRGPSSPRMKKGRAVCRVSYGCAVAYASRSYPSHRARDRKV